LREKAEKNLKLLRRLNVVTLCVAILVYLSLLVISLTQGVYPLMIFSSCIMLAELLVFQIVRTLSDYLELKCPQ